MALPYIYTSEDVQRGQFLVHLIIQFLLAKDDFKIFTEREAWALFKFTAIAESIGWILLLYGIAASQFHLFGSDFALPIGGSLHGMFFIAYLLIVVTAYSGLGWPRWKAIMGIGLSVVPLGTWALELREAHTRKHRPN